MVASTRRRRGRPPTSERTRGPFAPYAPIRAIDTVLSFHRERGFADPIDRAALERAGVAGSMSARTLQAMRFLALIDEGGYTTEELERIRRARDEELPTVLATLVRRAYAAVFAQVDPATGTDRQLNDAFRAHEPSAQRPKMIALFRALCIRAGLTQPRSREASAGRAAPDARLRDARTRRSEPGASYALVRGLLETLPADGHWSRAERDRWTAALLALLDLTIRVDEDVADASIGGSRLPGS